MLSKKHKKIAKEVIDVFIGLSSFTVESINEGSCEKFADYLIERYFKAGLDVHRTYSTYDFISPNADQSGDCEYMKDWREDVMESLGVPSHYFRTYRKQVEAIDRRGMVCYHVWLFDGEHHYDATCLDGIKNPLELPFFQLFTKERPYLLRDDR